MGVLDTSYIKALDGCEVGRAQKNIFGFSGHPSDDAHIEMVDSDADEVDVTETRGDDS